LWPGGTTVTELRGDQLAGSLLGQALGDALGFVVESQPPEIARVYVQGWLRARRAGEWSHPEFPFGQYTDDTQLARELVSSFRDAGGWDPAVFSARLAQLFQEQRDVGAGEGTRSAAGRLIHGSSWKDSGTAAPYAGNGAAMRAGPLGLLLPDPLTMSRVAREQASITHRDPRCGAGAIAIARAVALAVQRGPISSHEFLEDVADSADGPDSSFAEAVRGIGPWLALSPADAARQLHRSGLDPRHVERWQGISAFVIPSVVWTLYSFLRSPEDYWETICTAIEVGGDTDSMAAMAGAISGARLGPAALPEDLVGRLNDRGEWGPAALTELARSCAAIVASH